MVLVELFVKPFMIHNLSDFIELPLSDFLAASVICLRSSASSDSHLKQAKLPQQISHGDLDARKLAQTFSSIQGVFHKLPDSGVQALSRLHGLETVSER